LITRGKNKHDERTISKSQPIPKAPKITPKQTHKSPSAQFPQHI